MNRDELAREVHELTRLMNRIGKLLSAEERKTRQIEHKMLPNSVATKLVQLFSDGKPRHLREIVQETGLRKGTIRTTLWRLSQRGIIRQEGGGPQSKWYPADDRIREREAE